MRRNFIEVIQAMANEVADFHERWPAVARITSDSAFAVLTETLKLQEEEVRELGEEIDVENGTVNLENALLEAADVLFVALGTIYRMGAAADDAVRRVTSKNAAKTEKNYFFDKRARKVRKIGKA